MANFDAIVIGTGFGGAVAACRLVGAGKKICVLERGRRYRSQPPDEAQRLEEDERPWSDFPDLPRDNDQIPDPKRWAWGDDQGLWELRDLGDIMSAQAAGYGGGSLIYANVHLRAPKEIFEGWPFTRSELDPYYDLAAYMLNAKPITEATFPRPIKTEQFRTAAEGLNRKAGFFYPPLAVNFDGHNDFSRAQGTCNACGECITGCRRRAKNTLDFNYLAIVDDSPLADVLTQAEAVSISEGKDGGYDVEYLDHLRGGAKKVASAPWVFVCAGAVNSTELLWRSRQNGGLPKLNKKILGSRYYPNADFPAIVYDAQTPEDQPRLLNQVQGPTITACLYHEPPSGGANGSKGPRKPWCIVEDGGFPGEMSRHFGVFRAPALMRRNRHDDRQLQADRIKRIPGKASSGKPWSSPNAEPPLYRSLIDGLYALLEKDPETLEKLASEQLRNAVGELVDELQRFQATELEGMVKDVMTKTLERYPVIGALAPKSFIRRIRGHLIEDMNEVLRERYSWDYTASDGVELANRLGKWLLKFDDALGAHSENSLILLGMGPDSGGGRIKLKNGDPRVKMEFGWDAELSETEALMRDVACALGGKLRVNPLWSFARTPVTVHSQGGCPMSADPAEGVTDPHGEVHGHPGLFVMDAAAFPKSVGVNPSATILAIAERNMAQLLGDHAHKQAAVQWWARQAWTGREDVALEPRRGGGNVETINRPIGIEFSETMSGFHWATPAPGPDSAYREAEVEGREHGSTLIVELNARIEDVARFIHSEQHVVDIEGTAKLVWEAAGIKQGPSHGVVGTLKLPGSTPQTAGRMSYDLQFKDIDVVLTGFKRIRNDPGTDAWRDTSRLLTTLSGPGGLRSYGVIHVALDEFMFKQLPSFRVLNTDDPARVVWAVSSFGAYFFGQLQQIYAPQLEKAIEGFLKLDIR